MKYIFILFVLTLYACGVNQNIHKDEQSAMDDEVLKNFCRKPKYDPESLMTELYEKKQQGSLLYRLNALHGGYPNNGKGYCFDVMMGETHFSKEEIPYLVAHLKDDSSWVRGLVVVKIGEIRDKSAIPILTKVILTDNARYIPDDDVTIADIAYEALLKIGGEERIPALLAYHYLDDYDASPLVEIAKIGGEYSQKILKMALSNPEAVEKWIDYKRRLKDGGHYRADIELMESVEKKLGLVESPSPPKK